MNEKSKDMIRLQIASRGIKNKKILSVMENIPRDEFVQEKYRNFAYDDNPLPIGENQTISQPYMVARMTELLDITGGEKVLEIGTGSGYQAAVLARLSREVYTVERIESLSRSAQKVLKDLGYANIFFRTGDGTEGWPQKAPFDRIIVTAAAENVPDPLLEQLAENGKLLIPLGGPYHQQLTLFKKLAGRITSERFDACVFVPLIGKFS